MLGPGWRRPGAGSPGLSGRAALLGPPDALDVAGLVETLGADLAARGIARFGRPAGRAGRPNRRARRQWAAARGARRPGAPRRRAGGPAGGAAAALAGAARRCTRRSRRRSGAPIRGRRCATAGAGVATVDDRARAAHPPGRDRPTGSSPATGPRRRRKPNFTARGPVAAGLAGRRSIRWPPSCTFWPSTPASPAGVELAPG